MRFLKFDNPMYSFNIIKLSSATSTITTASKSTSTSASTIISRDSQQPEPVTAQRQQGSFVGLLSTIHTPESALIPATYHQQDELGLLPETDTTQITPFEALATQQTVIFDDEAVTTRIAGGPDLRSFQHLAKQSPDPTDIDKWIIVDKSKERPYRCGYPGCKKSYSKRYYLRGHFVIHTGKSKFQCPHPECASEMYFRDRATLKRHMVMHTSEKPFQCDTCERRFGRKDQVKSHRKNVHGDKEEKKSPKRKKK